jgi:HPt (histidine-containing phosphotransfer) domain-containing protein
MLSAIFEPFSKSEGGRPHTSGAGVGLSVAKHLVESAGGTIGVESEPGMGARFWINLPVAQAPAAADAPSGEPISAPGGLMLLVLARDPAIRTAITRMLTPYGNRLTFAENLGQASTISARNSFDVILSTAGHADSLAASPAQRTPILALAAWDERPPTGATLVLRWPASADALYSAITAVIGDRNAKAKSRAKEEAIEEALDAKAIAELEKSLGLKTLIDILQSYLQTAEQLAAAFTAASERADWTQASRLAQDIAGAAGDLGLTGITAAARALAQSARDGAGNDVLEKVASEVLSEHRRVGEALGRLYPDLASAPADAA